MRCHFSSDHIGDAAACRRPHSLALTVANLWRLLPRFQEKSARHRRTGKQGGNDGEGCYGSMIRGIEKGIGLMRLPTAIWAVGPDVPRRRSSRRLSGRYRLASQGRGRVASVLR
jgi:hypothetical protein